MQDQFEIKFRLTDGSDIGPKSFPAAASVATLKESILSQWPKGWFFDNILFCSEYCLTIISKPMSSSS